MPMYMDIHEIRGATAEDIPIIARYQAARRTLIPRQRQMQDASDAASMRWEERVD